MPQLMKFTTTIAGKTIRFQMLMGVYRPLWTDFLEQAEKAGVTDTAEWHEIARKAAQADSGALYVPVSNWRADDEMRH